MGNLRYLRNIIRLDNRSENAPFIEGKKTLKVKKKPWRLGTALNLFSQMKKGTGEKTALNDGRSGFSRSQNWA